MSLTYENVSFLRDVNILSSICKGDISELKFLQNDPTFHWSNVYYVKSKETCLHLAAQNGYIEIIDYLLRKFHPKTVDIRNIDNKTALHEAAQHGHFACVEFLIQNGADINAIKRADWTPLMLACSKSGNNYLKIVQYLLNKGAFVNFKNKDGWTALHIAARNQHSSILRALLTSTCINIAVKTKNGRSALHIAALHGNLDNVKQLIPLLDESVTDFSGNTPLLDAVLGGNIDVIEYIIGCGADVTAINKVGLNALHLAAGHGLNQVIDHLVQRYGIDVNSVDMNGYTPLHYACRKGITSTIDQLIMFGARTDIVDKSGRTAQDYALRELCEPSL